MKYVLPNRQDPFCGADASLLRGKGFPHTAFAVPLLSAYGLRIVISAKPCFVERHHVDRLSFIQIPGFAGQCFHAPEYFAQLLQGVVKRVLGKDSAWQVLVDLSPLIRLIITQPLP